ncbi:MAG: HigA family addiction module antidote protein [Mycoplasmataceae bacterium]|jgi:addiction module HigA family antidote|nr:HigA family addiction module antidote protein [Mycoplasmataceae bacterium]
MSRQRKTSTGDIGVFLKNKFLVPNNITQADLSRKTKITTVCISEIITGKRIITPDSDVKLTKFFELKPGYFLNEQLKFDVSVALKKNGNILDKITPISKTKSIVKKHKK